MTDMLVPLYGEWGPNPEAQLICEGIKFKRALAIDKRPILAFIEQHFMDICSGWLDECQAALYRHPSSCLIATEGGKVIGFCCYDGTAKGMVGPVGVDPSYRKRGIATALLHQSFEAMKMDGYAYAVIGWVSSEAFYEKTCKATAIANSFPGVYQRMVMEHGE